MTNANEIALEKEENKMGVMPIPKLLITMSLPMMISMLIQALYNIVDSMLVVCLNSEEEMRAGNSEYGKDDTAYEGKKDSVFRCSVSTLKIFAILGVSGSHFFFAIQTDNQQIVDYGTQYLSIITFFSVGIFLQITFERLLQSTGRTIYNMITQGTGAIINIILDPILIFGWFGLPRLEVVGAALATIIGQIIALSMSIFFNHTKNKEINLSMRHFRPHKRTISVIYKVGIPSIIMQSIGSVMTFGMNKILLMFSSTAVAVFGVYFKLQSFIFMPIFGLNNGMIPIIAYNYGARNKERIKQTTKLSIIMAIGIMFIGLIIFQTCQRFLLVTLFDASDHMLEIGVPALRIISLSFLFAGFCIIAGSVFQALGNGVYSLIVSVARQLVVILPVAYLFAKLFGLSMVWWSIPIAEIVSLTLSAVLLKRIYRLKVDPM